MALLLKLEWFEGVSESSGGLDLPDFLQSLKPLQLHCFNSNSIEKQPLSVEIVAKMVANIGAKISGKSLPRATPEQRITGLS